MGKRQNDGHLSNIRRRIGRVVHETIADHGMLNLSDHVLVGVSGGADSVALLYLLMDLRSAYKLELGIAHLNHGLRPDTADRDERFVEELARQLNLPIFTRRIDVRHQQQLLKRSIEETARIIRYRLYIELAESYRFDKIALGHHADDNAEAVLMQLIRGTGTLGLAGIPAVRSGNIIRPLIRLRRTDIRLFLEARNIRHIVDESNTDTRFLRNRIRHQLMPQLKASFNPRIVDALNRTADIRRKEEEWIADLITPSFRASRTETGANYAVFSSNELIKQPIGALRRIIRKAIEGIKGDLTRISYLHIESVTNLIKQGPPNGTLDLPDGIRVFRQYDRLRFERIPDHPKRKPPDVDPSVKRTYAYTVALPASEPVVVDIIEANLRVRFERQTAIHPSELTQTGQFVVFFDMDKLVFPLLLRNIEAGDRFQPLGMTGHQKVKKFFIDHKVPPAERNRCPILLSNGIPVWLVGHRLGDTAKLTSGTRRVLKAELMLA